ncbi:endothelial cell-specific chemotaxis regulator isoform X6 [Protopterus annectens]|uniref:endothelial cell-specific chemotaxis regulator isoform X6 n=1 Tax=Protopterus annectens TaxID=7888 RepID=UPI001CFA656D|nr:endothelial cell-specific chemotaxis regulator isoform X6 [Protopterus annectens]
MKMFPLNILFPLWMLCLSLEAAVEISPPTTTFTVLDEVQLSNLTSLNSSSAQESTEPQVLTIVAFGTQTRGHSIVPESGPPSNVEAENITLLSMKSLECNETHIKTIICQYWRNPRLSCSTVFFLMVCTTKCKDTPIRSCKLQGNYCCT